MKREEVSPSLKIILDDVITYKTRFCQLLSLTATFLKDVLVNEVSLRTM